jgi:hypothetical protein
MFTTTFATSFSMAFTTLDVVRFGAAVAVPALPHLPLADVGVTMTRRRPVVAAVPGR